MSYDGGFHIPGLSVYPLLADLLYAVLMVNKQGQTRLASYYDWLTVDERRCVRTNVTFDAVVLYCFFCVVFSAMESEIIRKCLSRTEMQCSFMEYRGMKVVYRRYASLFFIVGVEQDEEVCHWPSSVVFFIPSLLYRVTPTINLQ